MDGKRVVTWAQVDDASAMTSRADSVSLMWMRRGEEKQKRRAWGQLVPLLMGGARIDSELRPLAGS